MTPGFSFGRSSVVHMTLQVGNGLWLVSQMGPDFLILTEPSAVPPGRGTVILTVDGRSEEIPVLLPHGVLVGSRRVEIAEVGERVVAAA